MKPPKFSQIQTYKIVQILLLSAIQICTIVATDVGIQPYLSPNGDRAACPEKVDVNVGVELHP